MKLQRRINRIFETSLTKAARSRVAKQNIAWHFHEMDTRDVLTVSSLQLPPLPSKRRKFGDLPR